MRSAWCSAELALLLTTHTKPRERDAAYMARLGDLRDLIVSQTDDFLSVGDARDAVERRYLAGHPALFPDMHADSAGQVELAKHIGLAAVAAADRDGVAHPTPADSADLATRMARHEADLVEPARVLALEQIGEGHRAFRMAMSWVRGRLVELRIEPRATSE